MTTTVTLRHAPDCLGPDLHEFTGRRNDLMQRCRTCGRVAPAPPRGDTPAVVRFELECVDCERPIPCASAKPRTPLCPNYLERRAQARRNEAIRKAHTGWAAHRLEPPEARSSSNANPSARAHGASRADS